MWLFTVAAVFAQPNSPFDEGESQQGRHFENIWIGGGFTAGGMDLRNNGQIRIFENFLTRGTQFSWGDFSNEVAGFPEGYDMNIFIGNVPRIKIGTYVNGGAPGAEVTIGGQDLTTYFGGPINVNGGTTFEYYLEIISDDNVPETHPAYSITPQAFSYLTSDAVILDLFRDENITDIYVGGSTTAVRFGNRFVIDPGTNTIRSTGLTPGSTIGLFNDGTNVEIGSTGRNITIVGNLVVDGTSTFNSHITGGVGTGGTGSGGTFSGALPTHYTGLWRMSFTAAKPIIESDTNEYVYLFSGEFETNQFVDGDPFLGLKSGTLLGLTSRPGVIIGNASDVSIGNPDRIVRILGTTYFGAGTTFESGVTWEDVTLTGKTTFDGPVEILDVEEDDRDDYQISESVAEGEGEYIEQQDSSFEADYETTPALKSNEGLIHIEESVYIDGEIIKLANLPTEEPTGSRYAGALWVDEGEGTLMVAPGIDAPIPKLRWYYGESSGDLVIYITDASERSPDDPEGEGEPIFEGEAELTYDVPEGEGETVVETADDPSAGWTSYNFGTKDDAGLRNGDGGITITYTIGKEILSKYRQDSLIWKILPPPIDLDISPTTGVTLPATIYFTNSTVEGPIEVDSWTMKIVEVGGEGEDITIFEDEGEIEGEFELTEEGEGEGIGEVLVNTNVVFRLTGESLVNEAYDDVTVLVYPTE